MKRAPINTERESFENPWGVLLDGMAYGLGAIERQESQGQKSFVGSDTLPTDIRGKEHLVAAGVKFLGPVEGDPLFQYVELPKGWSKKPTDHAMWSHLVDDKGRNRAYIFYKAAFYDRSAFLRLNRRFEAQFDYDRFNKESVAVGNVLDCGKVIHSTTPKPSNGKPSYELSEEAVAEAEAWLQEKHPDWKSLTAYWD